MFFFLKCDCKAQLALALDTIQKRGSGAVVYLRQEGRGIGLGNKIKAYAQIKVTILSRRIIFLALVRILEILKKLQLF